MSDLTIDSLEAMAKSLVDKRQEVEEKRKIYSEANAELDILEGNAVAILKEIGKKSYKSEFGTVTRTEKWRVTLPNTPEKRAEFFQFLKEKDLFDKLISVNSNTLNSLYMEEWASAKERNPEEAVFFSMPGIDEPKLQETLSFRKK